MMIHKDQLIDSPCLVTDLEVVLTEILLQHEGQSSIQEVDDLVTLFPPIFICTFTFISDNCSDERDYVDLNHLWMGSIFGRASQYNPFFLLVSFFMIRVHEMLFDF